ncbi:hypothetical protein [Streptomyces glaucosporus]|uniref:hypothetical protein n=1 Tax=Streptomyces glaucosporus TaxID=284044 RepID=UPI0031D56422
MSPAETACRDDHGTPVRKWSVFRRRRQTAGHFVLLSRAPSVMCLDVLPKPGVREAGDVDRPRAAPDRHAPRV